MSRFIVMLVAVLSFLMLCGFLGIKLIQVRRRAMEEVETRRALEASRATPSSFRSSDSQYSKSPYSNRTPEPRTSGARLAG